MYYSKTTGGFYDPTINAQIPADAVEISKEQHEALLLGQSHGKAITADANGAPILADPVVTLEQIQAQFTTAIQARLDAFAKTRNYDGILSACSYVASSVPKFAAEGAYCVSARDATWATGYQILADVQSASRPMPTLEQVDAELPALEWPQ